jgi:hypothetical protein
LEARGGIEPPIKVLQTFALPLGDRASDQNPGTNRIPSSQQKRQKNTNQKQKTHLPAFPAVGSKNSEAI